MKKTIIKTVILVLFSISVLNITTFSQIKGIVISVDGFTCSLCAKGVEGQFKALDFVSSVKTDLKNASFDIKFKKDKEIDIKHIWNAVDDGGFTVGSVKVEANGVISKSGDSYMLTTGNSPELLLSGKMDGISEGDKVKVRGSLNTSYGVSISSITKN
jgi:copper chaperone CopZ